MLARLLAITCAWAAAWAAIGVALVALVAVSPSPCVVAGTGALEAARWFGLIGLCNGAVFAVAIAVANRGAPLARVPAWNVALWGLLSAAAFPLLSGYADGLILACPLGLFVALGLRWLAARLAPRVSSRASPRPSRT